MRERQGLPDVGVGHRAEDRPREPRPHGEARDRVLPERAAERGDVHVRRRLLARHAGVAALRGREERRQDHDRPGAVEPLGRGRRRQADPPGRRLRRDDRVEPLRLRPLAADALRRLRRPDALRHRRGGDDVRARLHDERRPRHARARDRGHLRLAPGRAPRRDRALQRDLRLRAPGRPGGHRVCGVFAPTDHLFFHTGWGCMSADFVLKDGGTIIYTSPSPGVSTAVGDFPGPGADGPDEAVHAADAGELPARAEGHPRPRRSRCGPAASGCRSTR